MTKKYFRSEEEVICDDSNIFPKGSVNDPGDPRLEEIRMRAILEFLRRIPEDVYKKLINKSNSFRWFIPKIDANGLICPFNITHNEETTNKGFKIPARAEVLYLSPLLEDKKIETVVVIVAHELAHIVLDHSTIVHPKNYQEIEAWNLVVDWGFGGELKKHSQYEEIRQLLKKDKL